MPHLKVFTGANTDELEEAVNAWIREQWPMIAIDNQQFSTNGVSETMLESVEYGAREIEGPLTTEYHVAIWYRKL